MTTQGGADAEVEVDGVGLVTVTLARIAPAQTGWIPSARVLVVDETLDGAHLVAAGIRWAEELRAS